ncbi:hypothetical protein V8E53_009495 [Lactarius tabidus]
MIRTSTQKTEKDIRVRDTLPPGHKTVFHPLQATTIEEAKVFQLGFGTFHLVMNLLWSMLETHCGSVGCIGSLSFFFVLLEKAHLGGEHPDYHTLLSAMKQILHGLILNTWQAECGHPSLQDFASANPSPEDLIQCAHKIIKKYTVPQPGTNHINKKAPPKDLETRTAMPTQASDAVHNNTALLTQDLLYLMELVDATASGDFGWIEDVLPSIACMFCGSGSNDYLTKILHFLFNLKEVWTPVFVNIMQNSMLVNPSGLPGHVMGINLNIKHLICYLKVRDTIGIPCGLFVAKGIYLNWDCLGNIAASINYLQLIKKHVTRSLGSGYQGSTHTDSRELGLQCATIDQEANTNCKAKFEASSLATFNKKIADMKQGIPSSDGNR